MKRLLLAAVLLCPLLAMGATPTITGVAIETNGWVADVFVSTVGLPPNGALTNSGVFDFGFGPSNSVPGKVAFTLMSPGFDDVGVSNNIVRTVYGTKSLRFSYPNHTNYDAVADGAGGIVVHIALSEFIYAGDWNVSNSIAANWYSNNTAGGWISVTNGSLAAYPKCIANWAWPGWQKCTGNTMTLRAVGFHRFGQHGRPLRSMRFVATGAVSGVSVTNFVTGMTIDWSVGDALPVCEYVKAMDISGMTQGEAIRCDFTAYPWVGDSTATMDTMDAANSMPTPYYAGITNICDRLGTYRGAIAVVSPAGNDTNGRASTNSDPASVDSSLYFASCTYAANRIAATNLQCYGRNDVGGGTIYLIDSNNVFGTSLASGASNPVVWLTITSYPGQTGWFTNQVGDKAIRDKTLLSNIGIYYAAGGTKTLFTGYSYLWTDGCTINDNATAAWYVNAANYVTRNTIQVTGAGLLGPFGNVNASTALARGNRIGTITTTVIPHCWLGNLSTTTMGSVMKDWSVATSPGIKGSILAFNSLSTSAEFFSGGLFQLATYNVFGGCAIVQNVIEKVSGTDRALGIGSDSSTSTNVFNVLFVNNTVAGQRLNWCYQNTPVGYDTTNFVRNANLLKNNLFDYQWTVSDADTHSEGPGAWSPYQTNNWSEYYGVGYDGNFWCDMGDIRPTYGFTGLNRHIKATGSALGTYNPSWVVNASYTGTTAGGGDYRLKTSSGVLGLQTSQFLPFDLGGMNRSPTDPPGPYCTANPKRTAAFLGL